ncbi:Brp/Blh family beta-carotene 15,15'-dioxygenase [Flavobacteriaceae bacterium]|nr:Brp/Blh family beta-carotene 15,15'-dioxygenase [Flavobacteriaceae bacterium]
MSNNISSKKDFYSVLILSSFFSLWLSTQISAAIESNIAYIMILTVGILHGSNDIMLINHSLKSNTNISSFTIFIFYVLMVGLVAVLFYFTPFLALSLFVIFSSYHFGEQHFISKSNSKNSFLSLYYTSYGMLIFSMIFLNSPDEVIIIVNEITNVFVTQDFFKILFYSSVIVTVILSFFMHHKKFITFNFFEEIILIILLSVIFNTASLIAGFAIYFIIWHSIPSLRDQIIELHSEFNKKTLVLYLKNSALYWLISIVSLFILYYIVNDDILFISLFFSFLSAITFPHVLVMFNLFKNKSNDLS